MLGINYQHTFYTDNIKTKVMEPEYDGLSLSVMKSLFFDKKLITTNESVINYDFYRKENIFILKDETWENLKEFMAMPYKEISKDIKYRYIIENWIEGFKIDSRQY